MSGPLRTPMPDRRAISEQYLLDYLKEEFRRHGEVRIRPLLEDKEPGISVKTEARTYFFPYDWAENDFSKVKELIAKIKEGMKIDLEL